MACDMNLSFWLGNHITHLDREGYYVKISTEEIMWGFKKGSGDSEIDLDLIDL